MEMKKKDFTVVSLVTNPDNLFDPDKGIYVTGTQYLNWKNSGNFNPGKSVWDPDNICNFFSRVQIGKEKPVLLFLKMAKLLQNKMLGLELKDLRQEILNKKILIYMLEKNMEIM